MKGALALRKSTQVPIANDCSGTTIPTASYLELTSSLPASASGLVIVNTSAKAIKLATGASGSEVDFVAIPPAAAGVVIPMELKKGVRLTARAYTADATTGFLTIAFFG